MISSYRIESDNPTQIKNKLEPREPLNLNLIKKNGYDELKKLEEDMNKIISNDWRDIINIEEWSSHSYFGFIQINTDTPIETFLEFKDCKLKTNYLFNEISSSSFDLRTYLFRKSRFRKH